LWRYALDNIELKQIRKLNEEKSFKNGARVIVLGHCTERHHLSIV
jgi:hypothetical protein